MSTGDVWKRDNLPRTRTGQFVSVTRSEFASACCSRPYTRGDVDPVDFFRFASLPTVSCSCSSASEVRRLPRTVGGLSNSTGKSSSSGSSGSLGNAMLDSPLLTRPFALKRTDSSTNVREEEDRTKPSSGTTVELSSKGWVRKPSTSAKHDFSPRPTRSSKVRSYDY
jgi:hypothetical protein